MDSGGIKGEATFMSAPYMTLLGNTKRPETISEGTNKVLDTNPEAIVLAMEKLFF